MDKSDVLILEGPVYETASLGQRVQVGVSTSEIYCCVKSVTRTEWASAAQNGKKAAYCMIVWADEYQGEPVAIYNGIRYGIYRTYQPNPEKIELYLEQKVGA